MNNVNNTQNTTEQYRLDLDAIGLGIYDGDCFFPVPLRWTFT